VRPTLVSESTASSCGTVADMPDDSAIGDHVLYRQHGAVAVVTLNRPSKRNALDTGTVKALGAFFSAPPAGVKAAVLTTSGQHFSAGLDLGELRDASVFEGMLHSQAWHQPFAAIEFGTIPVVAALRGAVIGGGLELALTAHIRVAEPSAYYALPEGSRGIFVGGGASVRLPRLIGVPRMADMMLTGRVLSAEEGQAFGITQYLAAPGESFSHALELAERIAKNSPVTNYAVMHALPRIAQMGPQEGLFTESLMAAIAQGTDEAKDLLREFLEGRAAKVMSSNGDNP
jgi:(methylthio)acryloyl-CoA hydratase